jgi:tetratricopeptide (TPR) repeat protein
VFGPRLPRRSALLRALTAASAFCLASVFAGTETAGEAGSSGWGLRAAHAGTLKSWAETADQKVLASLREKSPEAAAAFVEGNAAAAAGDHLRAFERFEAARQLLPENAALTRRVAFAAFRLDRRDEGLALARKALALSPSPDNQIALAQLLLQTEEKEDGKEASTLAVEAADKAPEDPLFQGVCCVVAAKWGPRDALHRCTNRYLATAPDEAEAHFYGAVAALDRDDVPVAQQQLAEAKELGLATPMALALEGRLRQLRPPSAAVNTSVSTTTRLFPLIYPALIASLWFLGFRLERRSRGPLADPRAKPSFGDVFDRLALQLVVPVFLVAHFVVLPIVVGLVVAVALVVAIGGSPPNTALIAVALLVGTGVALLLVRGVERPIEPVAGEEKEKALVDFVPGELEGVVQTAASRVGTYPAETVIVVAGGSAEVLENTSLLNRARGEPMRTLRLAGPLVEGPRGPLRAALTHAHARLATTEVNTAHAGALARWLETTARTVPTAVLVRLAHLFVGGALRRAQARQVQAADALVTYHHGADALAFLLTSILKTEGTNAKDESETKRRVAAARALGLTPRSLEADDDRPLRAAEEKSATKSGKSPVKK